MILWILWQGIQRWFSWTDNLERHGCPLFLTRATCVCATMIYDATMKPTSITGRYDHMQWYTIYIYPWKLTYPLKIDVWKMKVPFQVLPFSGYIRSFSGGGIISTSFKAELTQSNSLGFNSLCYTIIIINYLGFCGLMVRSCRFEFVYIYVI